MLPAAEVPTIAGGQEAALRQDGVHLVAPTHAVSSVHECGVEDVAGGCGVQRGFRSASVASRACGELGVVEAVGACGKPSPCQGGTLWQAHVWYHLRHTN